MKLPNPHALPPSMDSSEEGSLSVAGIAVADLASEYGTPTYVYDANRIRENYRRAQLTAARYSEDFEFYYAIKANNNLEVARILVEEGAGIDAASVNEIQLARALGVDGSRIIFSGNYLSDDDLEEGVRSGAIVNLDDHSLLPRLLRFGTPEILSFRVDPGFGASGVGEFVTNAGPRAKFGVHEKHIVFAYEQAKAAGVARFGAHMMPGSNNTDPQYFHYVTELLMELLVRVNQETGVEFEFIDLGGGLGIPYEPDESPLDLDRTLSGVVEIIGAQCRKSGMPTPKILMEPARYFVGDAGYLLGRVHTIKDSYHRIVGSDISMNVLARPALYDAQHRVFVDGKEDHRRETFGLCGQVCENTDFWCREKQLPEDIEEGDLLVVSEAGAYGYAMSYEYNGRLRPAEVLVEDGKSRLIRRRQTLADMVREMVLDPSTLERLERMS